MLTLQSHHITDLFVFVDDLIPKRGTHVGRPAVLSDSELVTVLIWNMLSMHQKTLKDIHTWAYLFLAEEFPELPKYSAFVDHCQRITPLLFQLLSCVLCTEAPARILDSTMVPVCKLVRADEHKVAKGITKFGKNWQGWHYGFKLHASIDLEGRLCGIALTSTNVHDAQMMPWLVNEHTRVEVGDTLYGARVMREYLYETFGTVIIAPPHPKQKKKLLTQWQLLLLKYRPKIESVFDYLKEHCHLVSSFPRSLTGYLFHYLRILLAYQLFALL